MSWIEKLGIVVFMVLFMECFAWAAHKYVMHGWGWWLHRSHHEEQLGALEANDVYLGVLAAFAISLIVLGLNGHDPLQWVGAGVAAFALIYVVVHDGIVHRHWPVRPKPRNRYLRRLYHGHLMHHAVKGRQNSVSFGFLYAPPTATLKQQLRDMRHRPVQQEDESIVGLQLDADRSSRA